MTFEREEWMDEIHPVLDRICMVEYKNQRVTQGGIHLPDGMSETGSHTKYGTVFAVGPGKRREDGTLDRPQVEIGQVVNFVHAHQFQELVWRGHKYFVVDENDCQVILDA